MTEYDIRPDGFSEIDRPKLGDAIDEAKYVLARYRQGFQFPHLLVGALDTLIEHAEAAQKELEEYR